REEWRRIVNSMISRGAPLNGDEAGRITDYLARNFGPRDRGKELFEDLCSSCHELGRVRNRELSREQWRQLVASMLIAGDAATEDEISLITEYLVKTFGTKRP